MAMSNWNNFIKRMCQQKAVYWKPDGYDGRGGYTFDKPVEIDCRWNDTREILQDNNGDEIVTNAEVLVLQDVEEKGMLKLGTLDDLNSFEETDPVKTGAYEIKRFRKIPSIDGKNFKRKAFL